MKRLLKIDWNKVERTIGGLKFAVVIILLFSISMIIGTFLESYYGTDFANRTVYKTFAFMLIQFGMLMSIIFAAFLRLPPKKRLYGFYTIHAGLIIIGVGSMITYIAGVDGSITLAPNEPNRQVVLSKDVLKFTYPEEGKQVTSELPYSAFAKEINEDYDGINVVEYIPFAQGKFVWTDSINTYPKELPVQSSKYFFKNPFASEEILLTLHPEASQEFQATQTMGPLTFNYMPLNLATCFEQQNPSGLIIWNSETGECFTPEEKRIPVKETTAKNRFVVIPMADKKLVTFFPDFSPFPVDASFQVDQKSIYRSFSKKLFQEKPALFLFGEKLAYYSKADNKWLVQDIKLKGDSVSLPWMGAEITLKDHQEKLVPFNLPVATVPIQKNGVVIKGDIRAVRLNILGKEYWATNYSPLSLIISGKKVIIEVTKESLTLPFELALTQFKMDKDPGTNNPASYESFVKLFSDGKMSNHHVFMNNPMKHLGFTFYQASYSQDSGGNYSTTLAVNVDQGRFLKYLGSLMLVFGGIWHYNLNKRKKGATA
ncbi:cytochrome c biogenesis protein ResB [Bacteriovorax sp. PP10]|uniref:Cytochrome c biogenesis protein ResB n=1 Tax=Bacteriovorax antarcticus TaxID=3088717 RepID=A0ABU5VY14_9BACT|nr:cytochrome c biogenesis protein ResB [Bacteriovorax sp. PP10]MEA9356505.1 cytochrome c biogenesis protein ResB [Bacteriovorax sp. PP10]